MGASLAKVVLSATWAGRLGHASRALFAHMALTAKDTDKPPRFFAGRDDLVLSHYGRLEADPAKQADQYRYISRLLREIRAAGGIETTTVAVRGVRTAGYVIRVFPVDVSSTRDSASGGRLVPAAVDKTSPPAAVEGTKRPRSVDETAIHRNHQETPQERDLAEDPSTSIGPGERQARARAARTSP